MSVSIKDIVEDTLELVAAVAGVAQVEAEAARRAGAVVEPESEPGAEPEVEAAVEAAVGAEPEKEPEVEVQSKAGLGPVVEP